MSDAVPREDQLLLQSMAMTDTAGLRWTKKEVIKKEVSIAFDCAHYQSLLIMIQL